MKTMKMALLAGAAVAVSTAAAHADELSDMKAQIEALNARVAAMETAVPLRSGDERGSSSPRESLRKSAMQMARSFETGRPWSPPIFEL